eukprot:gene8266-biopygen21138
MNPAVNNYFLEPPDGRFIGSTLAARPRKVQPNAVSQGEDKVGMDGHGAAGAACIPPQNKQRDTRCRRNCVTSHVEALCRLPWCEQVRRAYLRTCTHHGSLQNALGRNSKATNSVGNQETWKQRRRRRGE